MDNKNAIKQITHPIAIGSKITGKAPSCPCRNAKMISFTGTVGKVVANHTGFWYYINETNQTVNGKYIDFVN